MSFLLYADNANSQSPLLSAIDKKDTVAFNRILESGYNVNKRKLIVRTRYGISRKRRLRSGKSVIDKTRRRGMPLIYLGRTGLPLTEAAQDGNFYFVQQLLNYGAKPNKKGNIVLPPLGWAAHLGNLEIVKLLLDQKADINGSEKSWRTSPLIEAIEWKHWEIAKLLINKGADINLKDKNGKTALSHAAIHKNFEIAKILVDKGADVNHKDKYEEYVLEDACSSHHLFAETNTNIEVIKYLVEHGANTNNRAINTVLAKGESDIAKYLLSKGAPVSNQLVLSASNGKNFDLFKYLVDTMLLNIRCYDTTGYWGGNALHGVCRGYWGDSSIGRINIPMLKYILEKGINVNDTNHRGETPLLLLFENRKDDDNIKMATELLIKYGANVNIAGGDMKFSPLMSAASERLPETVKLLIMNGANMNYREKENRSVLHWAAWKYNNEKVISLLVSNGADINSRDDRGDTPAMSCVTFGRNENIKAMIELGLDLNIKNNSGYTLLDMISDEEIITLLKRKEAKSGKDLK